MDVTTMLSMLSLVKKLKSDYPQFVFKEGSGFLWSHKDQTVHYAVDDDSRSLLLHELSHGLLDHADYSRDIKLVAMERDAWGKAEELATNYGILITDDFIQSNLDTYRDWLHSRSTCPKCEATGLQTQKNSYQCLACGHAWRVNEARTCALRRYNLDR